MDIILWYTLMKSDHSSQRKSCFFWLASLKTQMQMILKASVLQVMEMPVTNITPVLNAHFPGESDSTQYTPSGLIPS